MKAIRLSIICTFALCAISAQAASGYHLLKTIPLPGDDQWDYISVDSTNRHVFVSHGAQLHVLDADSGAIIGSILPPKLDPSNKSTSQQIHGAAIANDLERGFTSNGRASSMTIFDLKTLQTIGEVKVGEGPDGYLYDNVTKRAFTFSNHTKGATAVEARYGKPAGDIPLGGKPEAAAVDGKGNVFVVIQDQGVLKRIDARKLEVTATWPLGSCKEPTSMASDEAHQRLFIGCHDKQFLVVNSESGQIVMSFPIGEGTDAAVFDPETKLVFVAIGEGIVTVIREDTPDKYTLVDNVKTAPGARTMGLDLKTHKLFLSLSDRVAPKPGKPAERRPAMVPGSFRVLILGN